MSHIFDFINSGAQSILPFVLLLGILIFVHELGHFMVARLAGVRVEVFSLGFGKKIYTRTIGDTTYALSLIPLGGYVKMFGDEVGKDIPEQDKAVSFLHKTVWQRIAIVLAGPLMNLFFAAFLFAFLAWSGESMKAPVLGDIKPATQAFLSGFRSGDSIVSVDQKPAQTWEDVQHFLSLKAGSNVTVKINRQGLAIPLQIQTSTQIKPNPNPLAQDSLMGDIEGFTSDSMGPMLGVTPLSMAYKLGFRTGDIVRSVNSVEQVTYRDLEPKLIALQGQSVTFKIDRPSEDGKKFENLELSMMLPTPLPSLSSLGIESSELYLFSVLPQSPASTAGLMSNDRIVQINDTKTNTWDDVLLTIKSYQGSSPIKVIVERFENETLSNKEFMILPQESTQLTPHGQEEKRKTIGIAPYIHLAEPEMVTVNYSVIDGLTRSIERSYQVSVMTIMSFVKLAQNKISPKTIGGVISIGQAASQTFQMGMSHFFTMMAIISINLFVLNLLPIPVLDGGHLLFYTVEAIRGSPLSMKKMEIAQQVGLVLLLSLMGFALFNDFSRLFGF